MRNCCSNSEIDVGSVHLGDINYADDAVSFRTDRRTNVTARGVCGIEAAGLPWCSH